jgi:enoyl-CoA hydratase
LTERVDGGAESRVLRERRGPVLVLTINRPTVRNALDFETAAALAAGIDELDSDDRLRVAILTGSGGYFSSGMDLDAFQRGDVPYVADRGIFGVVNRPPSKPLIAAVEGGALAGGFELMLACDMVVAADDARLGIPEVRRGLLAASGALLRLPSIIPLPVANEMAMTGEPVGAVRAAELGLVNRVVAHGKALATALELADSVAANAPLAVAASKRILRETSSWDPEEAWSRQGEIAGPVLTSEDAREGARAFSERRDPRWRGR